MTCKQQTGRRKEKKRQRINYPMFLYHFKGQFLGYRSQGHHFLLKKVTQLHLMLSHLTTTQISVLEVEDKVKEKHML